MEMSISKLTAGFATTGLLILSMLGSSVASAAITGIPLPGSPSFTNDVKVRVTPNGKWAFTGTNLDFSFKDNGDTYAGTQGKFTLRARFDSNNNLMSGGTVSIRGAIDSLGITDNSTILFTADLVDFGFDGHLMAFRTENLSGAICPLFGCTLSESVWFNIDALIPANLKGNNFTSSAFAITTIPVPAAVWLFGSGLGFLGATAMRRKKEKTAV